ncbi:MAG: aspartate dehydrogenase [Dehalococcoidia bacterium]|nr:aspartate dehydrogenase [Dehalococcoidia bacterium]
MKSIGIVGCGSIGKSILHAVDDGRLHVKVAGVSSRTEASAREYLSTMKQSPPFLSRSDLIAAADILIETAGGHVVDELAREAFDAGKDVMVISIGALLDHMDLFELAREKQCRLILPSGAIAGLDAIKGACVGQIDYVRLTSRKPARALQGAPFLVQNGISLDGLEEERLLFSGPAREAVRGFPDNLNISAALSLSGIGPDKTQVSISAVPGLQRNCHDIEVEGEFGLLRIHLENIPSENPKTGRLTALSMIRAVQDAVDYVRVGT